MKARELRENPPPRYHSPPLAYILHRSPRSRAQRAPIIAPRKRYRFRRKLTSLATSALRRIVPSFRLTYLRPSQLADAIKGVRFIARRDKWRVSFVNDRAISQHAVVRQRRDSRGYKSAVNLSLSLSLFVSSRRVGQKGRGPRVPP